MDHCLPRARILFLATPAVVDWLPLCLFCCPQRAIAFARPVTRPAATMRPLLLSQLAWRGYRMGGLAGEARPHEHQAPVVIAQDERHAKGGGP